MSYTRFDFPTKKALKEAVASGIRRRDLTIKPTSIVGDDPVNGTAFLEGPQYPKPHSWYAKVQVKDGVVVKVLS